MTAAPGTRETLAEALTEHDWRAWECSCGVHGRDVSSRGDASVEDCHLADVALAWLADALADEETVIAVKAALWGVRADVSSATDVALAALRERLGVDGGEED